MLFTNVNANEIITANERESLEREIINVLKEYDYSYTETAVNKIINTWAVNNHDLIAHFKKHPNYVEGKFLIAFSVDIDRPIDMKAVYKFKDWLLSEDQLYTMRGNGWLPEEVNKKRMEDSCVWLPSKIRDVFYDLEEYANEKTLNEEKATILNEIFPNCHVRKGKKTSRVFNEIFTYLGYAKLSDYNRQYAKFADALSPITITRHTVLSIHPVDYLTMSFGNSWASCHTIDKENKRCIPNSYHGMYSSGTVSYMLDSSSMVFYTVDTDYKGTDFWTQPKINRQMFHWGEEKLVQGRLYPQDNDGDSSAYTPYRNIVQGIMSLIYDFPNLWTVQKGSSDASRYIISRGTHYRDYSNFDSCTLSRIKGTVNDDSFTVGHNPICVECGYTHTVSESINCCGTMKCKNCGCIVDEDDVRYVNGDPYCEDCASYCDCCGEYVLGDLTSVEGRYGNYVCEDCLSEYYEYCNDCDEYHSRENMYYIEDENRYVCRDCIDNYTYCPECGFYYSNDSTRYVESENAYICDNCIDEYFTECCDCGEYYRNRDIFLDENDNPRCEDCHERHQMEEAI